MTAKFINRRLVTIEPVRNFRRTVPKPTTSNGLKPAGEFPAKNRDLGTGLSSELLPVNRDPASQPLRQADDGIAKSPTQRLPMTAILAPARKFAEGEIESLAGVLVDCDPNLCHFSRPHRLRSARNNLRQCSLRRGPGTQLARNRCCRC